MRICFYLILLFLLVSCQSETTSSDSETMGEKISLSIEEANKLSKMAFHCIDQEYPNKLGQVLGDSSYLAGPRELHPAFYGCFDWHSAVHGHWALVRILKSFPEIELATEIRKKLAKNLTAENIKKEVLYFQDKHNKNYERTYGWAWLLKLLTELDSWDDPQGKEWRENLRPLEELIVDKYLEFLPKLSYPIRVGEHPNTAFGLTFAWDYAIQTNQEELKTLIESRARDYYMSDKQCPLSWEPGGFDFLSPCLQEADIMSRVLGEEEFERWFADFLPNVKQLKPAVVSDRSDGKIVHLDGLNFSRAWVLYRLTANMKDQKAEFVQLADEHMSSSLEKMTSGDYAGEHWLASFALYALSSKESLTH
ncbi:MAG: DUF2891 domain-containing protein [Bacteroidia bacterium]|nr:DUF2891 domain-containing protein [Bacteroidia bacterium]